MAYEDKCIRGRLSKCKLREWPADQAVGNASCSFLVGICACVKVIDPDNRDESLPWRSLLPLRQPFTASGCFLNTAGDFAPLTRDSHNLVNTVHKGPWRGWRSVHPWVVKKDAQGMQCRKWEDLGLSCDRDIAPDAAFCGGCSSHYLHPKHGWNSRGWWEDVQLKGNASFEGEGGSNMYCSYYLTLGTAHTELMTVTSEPKKQQQPREW